jgi:Ca2+-transporting ATPase
MAKFNGFTGDYNGLTVEEVQKQQNQYGFNELAAQQKETFWHKIITIFKEPMFLLLAVTALLYFALGEPHDGLIMLGFVIFMSGINLFQEWRTDRTLQALKELSSPKVTVIRHGELLQLESRMVTVNDLMILEEGDKVSADGEIIEMFDLGIDESTLTGESEVVWKKIGSAEDETVPHWRKNCCYAGTVVTQGSAVVKVTAIGVNTEYGKIGTALIAVPQEATPLEKQTRKLIKISALIGLGLFVLVTLFSFLNFVRLTLAERVTHSILAGITLAMAMIPEEFPVILTVFLAMGAWRLAKKKSLMRRMPSVETLGAVSVLCVDKTGTLTRNQMTVQEIYCYNSDRAELLTYSGLGCEKDPYDPMEKAILAYSFANGVNKEDLFNKTLLSEYPLSAETKMMGHVWEIDGKTCLAAKGSPESILALCDLTDEALTKVTEEQNRLAQQGFRVIAVAQRTDLADIPEKLTDNRLAFLGLIGLEDPPRDAVANAVEQCNRAGLRVVMITGDNGTTAAAIARKIGLQNYDKVLTGAEIEQLSEAELSAKLKANNIFARVIPNHKMRIVKGLKANGAIVAMTGDGVNDAPALKYADIGIAMGGRGANVAKEAADMVLLDDNFTTIVDTIKDGRRIYDNIKKAVGYVFVIHIPIALIALLSPMLGISPFLFPIHIVLLELIIDPTCSIIFERQPAESDIMDRLPRKASEPLVTKKLMLKTVLQGLVIFGASFGSYVFLLNFVDPSGEMARSFALAVLIISNFFLIFVNQSEKTLAVQGMFKCQDKVTLSVNAGIVIALAVSIYLPFGNQIAKTAPLELGSLLAAIGTAGIATFWWELIKVAKVIKGWRGNVVRPD